MGPPVCEHDELIEVCQRLMDLMSLFTSKENQNKYFVDKVDQVG